MWLLEKWVEGWVGDDNSPLNIPLTRMILPVIVYSQSNLSVVNSS